LNDEWLDAARNAARHYEASGFSAAWCVGDIARALYFGSTPVDLALAECEGLLEANRGDGAIEASLFETIGSLLALQGRFDEGRQCITRAVELWEERAQPAVAAGATFSLGVLDELHDRLADAAEAMVRGCQASADLGEHAVLSSRAARLAGVLHAQSQADEAREWCEPGRAHAAEWDVHAQALWRSARAKIEARAGNLDVAGELSSQAVALLEPTDALIDRGNVLIDRAEVLRAADEHDEAISAARRAFEVFTEKGTDVPARRARALLEQTTTV